MRILVGFAAGSGPDIIARAVGQQIGSEFGHNFYVENRLGANGTIAAKAVADAAPDGHTLLYSSAAISTTPYVYKKAGFDLLRDLAPIATVGILDGYLMMVNPKLPVRSVPEFIAYAKANRILYGSPGVGNQLHLTAELFNIHSGLKIEHVPYRGVSEVVTALMQGSIHVMFSTPTAALPLVEQGQLRAIGFNGTKPFPELPHVPLVSASVPTMPPSSTWGIFFAPAKTDVAIVDRLNAAIQRSLNTLGVMKVVRHNGYVPDGRNAVQTAEFLRKEVEEAGEAVRAAGIQPN